MSWHKQKYIKSSICLLLPQKFLSVITGILLNFFQIKMAFNSWNYQTMKHSWEELIIIISCCFLRIHSWLKGLSLLFQNKVMRWLFFLFSPFCFTNENILSLMLHSDLCHITWQVHWRVIFCLLLPASVKQKITYARWLGWLLSQYVWGICTNICTNGC